MEKLFDSRGKIAMFIITVISSFLSFTFTLDMLVGEANTVREKLIVIATVIVLEGGKYWFVHKLLLRSGNMYVNLFFTVFLTVISLLCSGAYLVNKSNNGIQIAKQTNPRYIELTEMIEEKKVIKKDYLKWDRVTKANGVQDEINAYRLERKNLDFTSTATNGRTALFLSISKLTGVKANYVVIAFNLLISLMTELLAIGFANEYLKYFRKQEEMETARKTVTKSISKPIKTEVKPKVEPTQAVKVDPEIDRVTVKNKEVKTINDIDFSDKPFTKEEFKEYVKMMNDTEKNGIAKGYKKIWEFIAIDGKFKMSQVKCGDIRKFLERIKVVESVGNRTKIVERIKV